jgi:hypothetical protein
LGPGVFRTGEGKGIDERQFGGRTCLSIICSNATTFVVGCLTLPSLLSQWELLVDMEPSSSPQEWLSQV